MRETSLEAWEAINADGTIGERQRQAYNTLFKVGPLTGQELALAASSPGIWKRLSELQDLGVVREVGKRKCGVTGRMAILWDVTRELPMESAPEMETAETAKQKIARLERENSELRAKLAAIGRVKFRDGFFEKTASQIFHEQLGFKLE